jgi:hypothetical protein
LSERRCEARQHLGQQPVHRSCLAQEEQITDKEVVHRKGCRCAARRARRLFQRQYSVPGEDLLGCELIELARKPDM